METRHSQEEKSPRVSNGQSPVREEDVRVKGERRDDLNVRRAVCRESAPCSVPAILGATKASPLVEEKPGVCSTGKAMPEGTRGELKHISEYLAPLRVELQTRSPAFRAGITGQTLSLRDMIDAAMGKR